MEKLTRMQQRIYDYLRDYIERNGYPPSVREISEEMGLKSPSTAHFHLKKLEDLGVIVKNSGKGRAIALAERPDDAEEKKRRIPILGTVAAGAPILAQECAEDFLTLDSIKAGEDSFALRVRGDSMINAGIFPGDYVVVRQQSEANNGEIVVAMLGDEATVKRFSLKRGHIWLLPENDAYSPIDGADSQILGIVTAVLRFYERG